MSYNTDTITLINQWCIIKSTVANVFMNINTFSLVSLPLELKFSSVLTAEKEIIKQEAGHPYIEKTNITLLAVKK